MPLYEYRCRNCGERFEELVRMGTADSEIACPKCGKTEADKELSAFATLSASPSMSCSPAKREQCESSGFS